MVEMANTNTLSSVVGIPHGASRANVLATMASPRSSSYAAATGESRASKQMNVHVYDAFFADGRLNSNCYIDTDGIVMRAYKGDGGLLSSVRSTFQSITKMTLAKRGHRPKSYVCECFDRFEVTGERRRGKRHLRGDFVGSAESNVSGVAWEAATGR